MLTRLKISNFKNLVDVDVRFGTFTCIAGANGVGKSNLFDAIKFLSLLADRPLVEAALSIRGKGGHAADILHLFHQSGYEQNQKMSFEAEMIIPSTGQDDLGQQAKTVLTFLRYRVVVGIGQKLSSVSPLELLEEELLAIPKKDIKEQILFPQTPEWYQSVFFPGQKKQAFISTRHNKQFIILHGEGKSRLLSQPLGNLPSTVLSSITRAEHSTALLAKREMQSWRLLQLEPSALRQSDELSTAPATLGTDGAYLAKTLYALAKKQGNDENKNDDVTEQQIYGQIANRLAELIDDVHSLRVEHDNQRDFLTVQIAGRDGIFHPARVLSEGTLRFLALAVLEQSAEGGLWCVEEPENGIHPGRIEAIIRLLEDIAMDTAYPIDSNNPFRQIIVNTHSPSVVALVPDNSLLVAELTNTIHQSGQRLKKVSFACLPNTWRTMAKEKVSIVTKGQLLDYLNPIIRPQNQSIEPQKQRVKDRTDLQILGTGSVQCNPDGEIFEHCFDNQCITQFGA